MLIGRSKQQEELRALVESRESQFCAIYGRRRIGKTYLVRETFNYHFTFQHTGLADQPLKKQLSSFRDSLISAGAPKQPVPKNWSDAFTALQTFLQNSEEKKKIIFIDELSWIDTPKSGFVSALEHFWNAWATARKEQDIVLIVCGSSTSWITNKIINNHGTAPGAWFEQDGHCAVLMPGVPHEMKAMWEESVRPLLLARQSCALHSLTLRVLGGESNLEYRVRPLLENPNPTAAIYCKTGECEIRITARAQNDTEAQTMCRAYAKKFYDLLGDAVYDEDVAGLEDTVVHTLQANGLTIATAESCTGGMIAQRLTSVSGASEVFGYGFVTYWEQAKAKLVGVDPAVIAQYNVVSAPVAAQMALGAAKAAGADIAVSVTGLAGPGGGDAVRPVGTVYLGAARGDKVYVKKLFVSRPDRALIRARAAQTALEMALRLAQGKTPAGTQVLAESAQHDPAALTALDETLRAE